MATLSMTLPISCQICLGKVKDPVICPNSHAFCAVCLDMWLKGNNCCPTCRVDITKETPYRKVLGSAENNDGQSLQTRTRLRKTRLELLGREYETEIESLSSELNHVTEENKRLKEQLKSEENLSTTPSKNPCSNLMPNNVETFSNLTKKLQEISSTYDDVQRDMNKLKEDKEHLQRENNDLKNEVERLKEDSKFTKSPKRFEKFTITGLKAKVDQYEKENQQLRKALQKSDQYVEELQIEIDRVKSGEVKGVCERGTQVNINIKIEEDKNDVEENGDHNGSFTNSAIPIFKHSNAACTTSTFAQSNSSQTCASESHTNQSVTTSSSPHSTFPVNINLESYRVFSAVTTPNSTGGDYLQGTDLFPATKKLLELKKIHETRNLASSSSPPVHPQSRLSPALDVPWSPRVSPCVHYDSSSDTGDENCRTVADQSRPKDDAANRSRYGSSPCVSAQGEQKGTCMAQGEQKGTCMEQSEERGSCMEQSEKKGSCMQQGDERGSCVERPNVSGVALNSSPSASAPESSSSVCNVSQTSDQRNSGTPKRKDYQPVYLNKKIKIENP